MKEILRLLGTSFGEDCVCIVGTGDGIRAAKCIITGVYAKSCAGVLSYFRLACLSTKEIVGVLCEYFKTCFFYYLKTFY